MMSHHRKNLEVEVLLTVEYNLYNDMMWEILTSPEKLACMLT